MHAYLTSLQFDIDMFFVHQIIESSCSNHITGDNKKLQNLTEYKGGCLVVTANESGCRCLIPVRQQLFPGTVLTRCRVKMSVMCQARRKYDSYHLIHDCNPELVVIKRIINNYAQRLCRTYFLKFLTRKNIETS